VVRGEALLWQPSGARQPIRILPPRRAEDLTPRDRDLTLRDMVTMVRASGARGYRELMRSLGHDPARLLRRCRIPARALDDDEALLPLRSTVQLLELSAAETRTPDFGLRMSRSQDISVLGPLAIVLRNAPTVKSALDYASRYLFVHSTGIVLSVHDDSPVIRDGTEVSIEVRVEGGAVRRQTEDLCLADLHHISQLLAGPHYELRAVTLAHSPLAPLSTYRQVFGAPVLPNQPRAGLHVSRRTLESNLKTVDHTLRQIAVDYLATHFGSPDQALGERVRQVLRRTLGTPQGSKDAVAELLGMHPRTLQRRLDAEGSGFDAIREELRREAALRYLRETRIPLGQLAGMLGFSEQSAFTRSCRRWFGQAPSALRKTAG